MKKFEKTINLALVLIFAIITPGISYAGSGSGDPQIGGRGSLLGPTQPSIPAGSQPGNRNAAPPRGGQLPPSLPGFQSPLSRRDNPPNNPPDNPNQPPTNPVILIETGTLYAIPGEKTFVVGTDRNNTCGGALCKVVAITKDGGGQNSDKSVVKVLEEGKGLQYSTISENTNYVAFSLASLYYNSNESFAITVYNAQTDTTTDVNIPISYREGGIFDGSTSFIDPRNAKFAVGNDGNIYVMGTTTTWKQGPWNQTKSQTIFAFDLNGNKIGKISFNPTIEGNPDNGYYNGYQEGAAYTNIAMRGNKLIVYGAAGTTGNMSEIFHQFTVSNTGISDVSHYSAKLDNSIYGIYPPKIAGESGVLVFGGSILGQDGHTNRNTYQCIDLLTGRDISGRIVVDTPTIGFQIGFQVGYDKGSNSVYVSATPNPPAQGIPFYYYTPAVSSYWVIINATTGNAKTFFPNLGPYFRQFLSFDIRNGRIAFYFTGGISDPAYGAYRYWVRANLSMAEFLRIYLK